MQIKLGELLDLVGEARIGASAEYMKKERVREQLQHMIAAMIASGDVTDQSQLDEVFSAFDMSVKALKMVPYEVWTKMAGARSKPVKTKKSGK